MLTAGYKLFFIMRTEGKLSKVALCPNCDGFVMAGHIDYSDKQTEKEFTELSNEGFTIKLETLAETKARKMTYYSDCVNDGCLSK